MPSRLDQLWSLAPWERRTLVRLVVLLPAVGAALHLLGFKRTHDLLGRLGRRLPRATDQIDSANAPDTVNRIARLVSIAAYHGPYHATCLRQSLALWWLLRRRGITAELRFGVRKDGDELQAHAWVEHEGQALNDIHGVASSYTAFGPLPPSSTAPLPREAVSQTSISRDIS